jgi:hypothetical protein
MTTEFNFVLFFFVGLLLSATSALPPGSGSLTVSVNEQSYRTGETIIASIAPGSAALPDMADTFDVVVRRCNAILASTCTEQKYRDWAPQPFKNVINVAPVS